MRGSIPKYPFALFVAVVVAACGDVRSPTDPDHALPQAGVVDGGVLMQENVVVPWEAEVLNPCEGETVSTEGSIQVLYELLRDATGDLHEVFHTNAKGVVGVGQSTGVEYRVASAEQSIWSGRIGGDWQSVHPGTLRLVGRGQAESFHLRFNFFVTRTDGAISIRIGTVETSCR